MRRTDWGRMPAFWIAIAATGIMLVAGSGVLAQDVETRSYLPFALWGEVPSQPTDATPTALPTSTPPSASATVPSPTATADPTSRPSTATPGISPTAGPLDDDHAAPVVVVPRDIDAGEWSSDAVEILEARIDGNVLQLDVRYGGGCLEHDFWLAASSFFMESQPPQVAVMLSHDGHGDLCRALIFRTLRFDLSPLRRTFLEGGDPEGHGTLLLRLRDHAELIRYDF